MEYDDTNKT